MLTSEKTFSNLFCLKLYFVRNFEYPPINISFLIYIKLWKINSFGKIFKWLIIYCIYIKIFGLRAVIQNIFSWSVLSQSSFIGIELFTFRQCIFWCRSWSKTDFTPNNTILHRQNQVFRYKKAIFLLNKCLAELYLCSYYCYCYRIKILPAKDLWALYGKSLYHAVSGYYANIRF